MKNVFVDSDTVLDVFMARQPYYGNSAFLLSLMESGKVHGYVSPLIFSNIHYILRRSKSRNESLHYLRKLKLLVGILSIDSKIIDLALSSHFKDFEDAIQYYTALQNNMDCIITRNKSDYQKSKIPIYTAEEYIHVYNLQLSKT